MSTSDSISRASNSIMRLLTEQNPARISQYIYGLRPLAPEEQLTQEDVRDLKEELALLLGKNFTERELAEYLRRFVFDRSAGGWGGQPTAAPAWSPGFGQTGLTPAAGPAPAFIPAAQPSSLTLPLSKQISESFNDPNQLIISGGSDTREFDQKPILPIENVSMQPRQDPVALGGPHYPPPPPTVSGPANPPPLPLHPVEPQPQVSLTKYVIDSSFPQLDSGRALPEPPRQQALAFPPQTAAVLSNRGLPGPIPNSPPAMVPQTNTGVPSAAPAQPSPANSPLAQPLAPAPNPNPPELNHSPQLNLLGEARFMSHVRQIFKTYDIFGNNRISRKDAFIALLEVHLRNESLISQPDFDAFSQKFNRLYPGLNSITFDEFVTLIPFS